MISSSLADPSRSRGVLPWCSESSEITAVPRRRSPRTVDAPVCRGGRPPPLEPLRRCRPATASPSPGDAQALGQGLASAGSGLFERHEGLLAPQPDRCSVMCARSRSTPPKLAHRSTWTEARTNSSGFPSGPRASLDRPSWSRSSWPARSSSARYFFSFFCSLPRQRLSARCNQAVAPVSVIMCRRWRPSIHICMVGGSVSAPAAWLGASTAPTTHTTTARRAQDPLAGRRC